ncbi:RNase H-like domain-containing protein, partial [Muricoccus nepalensis]|uniref:RNase H-like domain-containing protein n=1 Tax=Muricoccus nepalensis TaxID=1854500 RepID=UPI00112BC5F3
MDDILIPGKTREECREDTIRVLRKCDEADLPVNAEKSFFEVQQVDYLGFILGNGELRMDPVKVEGLAKWPTPKSLKELRTFLGFGNFYRRFIPHYSDIAAPLHALMKKDAPFIWTEDCQKAFQTLKDRFTSYPVLRLPDPSRPFQIEADASKYASGAVLTQLDENGARHPVAYLSKTFDEAQRNYEIYDRELLAIIRALEEWRHFIQGSPFVTTIYSDHRNLTYW